jgi:hypothetical protein
MTSTEVALFEGQTAEAVIAHASDAARQLNDVVRKQRMFTRIGQNDHIHVEAWQTIGAIAGVVVSDGEIKPLPWPQLAELPDEVPIPDREPRDRKSKAWREWKDQDEARELWELHRDMLRARALGRTFAYQVTARATKNGQPVGWAIGICARDEPNHVNDEDHALSGMAQARGQGRGLAAPLRFVVKLAGYEGTPIEELDGRASDPDERVTALEAEVVALTEKLAEAQQIAEARQGEPATPAHADAESMNTAMAAFNDVLPDLDGFEVLAAIGRAYGNEDGSVPEVAARTIRIVKWAADQAKAGNERYRAPAPAGGGS